MKKRGINEWPLYIRLPGTKPDFADQHLREGRSVFAADGQRIEGNAPLALVIRRRAVRLACDGNGDGFAGSSLAPDGIFQISL